MNKQSFIQIVVKSNTNIIVQPKNAEAYEYTVCICNECQSLANDSGQPVVLIDKQQTSQAMPFEFIPR